LNNNLIKLKRGLNIPVSGEPEQIIHEGNPVNHVAILGMDYVGMKPTMEVRVADQVKKGQLLFSDKKNPEVKYTSPGSGIVVAIRRGEKRALLSVVIKLAGDDELRFQYYTENQLATLNRVDVINNLIESGLWTALRTRPFSKVANPKTLPHSIFITAMDTNPLSPDVNEILKGHEEDFVNGLRIVSRLTEGKIFICKSPHTTIPDSGIDRMVVEEFDGPHPAGNVGTHIHFLNPVNRKIFVWHVGLQDVIAIGILFTSGELRVGRIASLAGPSVIQPRLIKTRLGASLEELTAGNLKEGEQRIVSGSLLSGHKAKGATSFLGRYHQQVSVISESRQRKFLGWLYPGMNHYSVKNIQLSNLIPNKTFDFTTSINGEVRPIIPTYSYEKIMPLDIMPLFLLRALAVNDVEEAENLGCLELDEEDLSLCAFVCPSKLEFGPMLRRNLTMIEKEG
jgi:Na+-transporting NADH:ubiquinone oxidoreductase subunit A